MTESKRIANEKLKRALRFIDEAAGLLSNACGELSPLVHAIDQWELVGKHYDLVRQLGRDVSYTINRDKIDMDSDWKENHPEPEAPKSPNTHMEVQSEQ